MLFFRYPTNKRRSRDFHIDKTTFRSNGRTIRRLTLLAILLLTCFVGAHAKSGHDTAAAVYLASPIETPPISSNNIEDTMSNPQDGAMDRVCIIGKKNPHYCMLRRCTFSRPDTKSRMSPFSVNTVGSGNWGSAIATMVGKNCQRLAHCEQKVNMWVYEEIIEAFDGSKQKLTDIINSQHENVKYLPGIQLPKNVVAVADLATACEGATLLIFVLPHQFLPRLLPVIRKHAHPGCRGVSLIKGLGKYHLV